MLREHPRIEPTYQAPNASTRAVGGIEPVTDALRFFAATCAKARRGLATMRGRASPWILTVGMGRGRSRWGRSGRHRVSARATSPAKPNHKRHVSRRMPNETNCGLATEAVFFCFCRRRRCACNVCPYNLIVHAGFRTDWHVPPPNCRAQSRVPGPNARTRRGDNTALELVTAVRP